jgi:DNA polymerase-3 subunit gamma/tau
LLDQAVSYADKDITIQDVHDINGTINNDEVREIITNLLNEEITEILKQVDSFEEQGKSIERITKEIIEELKNIILYCNAPIFFNRSDKFYEDMKKRIDNEQMYKYIYSLSNLCSEMRKGNNNKILFEIEMISLIGNKVETERETAKESSANTEVKIEKPEKQKTEIIKAEEKAEEPSKIEEEKPIKENPAKVDERLLELKKIRINNSLVNVSQKTRKEFIGKLEDLKPLLMNPEYSKSLSLLFDGELKSISDKNLIFVYKTDLLSEAFNLDLLVLERVFKDAFNEAYRLIAVSEEEWKEIKEAYNKNKNSYEYQEETIDVAEIFKGSNKVQAVEANEIDCLFDEIVEYI